MNFKKLMSSVIAASMVLSLASGLKVNAASVAIDVNNFPDEAFRTYILDEIDNGNGVLEENEILRTTNLQIGFLGVSRLDGIKNFTNLQVLGCEGNSFTTFDVSGMTNLKEVFAGGGAVTSINVAGCTGLTSLSFWGNAITSVDLSGAPNLTYADFNSNNVTSINVASNSALETLWLNGNSGLGSIDVTNNAALVGLYVNNCALTTLNVSNNTNLEELMFGGNSVASIDLSHNTGLRVLDFSSNGITEIDLQNNSNIERFICYGNPCNEYYVGSNSVIFDALDYGDYYPDFDGHALYEYEDGGLYIEIQCDADDELIPSAPGTGDDTPVDPTPTPDPAGVASFVYRLYAVALGRPADEGGVNYWVGMLRNNQYTGVSASYDFFKSDEYQSSNKSNGEYIDDLYRAFFGRETSEDPAGKAYWVNLLESGVSRDEVFAGFSNSDEFYNLCNEYGILAGTFMPGCNSYQVAQTNFFVQRLYSIILGRNCDRAGMEYWTIELVTGNQTGAKVADGFVFSPEYRNKNKGNEAFLTDLYRAIMGREPDESGLSYWGSWISGGAVDREIFNGFIVSDEFTGICANYGIVRGDKVLEGEPNARSNRRVPNYRIYWDDETNFIGTIYAELLGYNGNANVILSYNDNPIYSESTNELVYASSGMLPEGYYTVSFYSPMGFLLVSETRVVTQDYNLIQSGHSYYGAYTTDCYQNTANWWLYDVDNDGSISGGIVPYYCTTFQLTAEKDPDYNETLWFTWYYSADGDFAHATACCSGRARIAGGYYECDNTNGSRYGSYWCVVSSSSNEIYVIYRCER